MSSSARRKIVETHTEIADLRSANADLKRQLEDAKAESRDACIGLNDYFGKKLTESQSREGRLRYYLRTIADLRNLGRITPEVVALKALTLPQDDTALREYRDAVIDECIQACGVTSRYHDMTGSDCVTKLSSLKSCKHEWDSNGDPGPGEVMTLNCRYCGKEQQAKES